MKFNLVYNKIIPNYEHSLELVEDTLISRNIEYQKFELSELSVFGDISIVIGGDGTLLRAARFYANSQTPVLGINLGRLGFLSQIEVNSFDKEIDKVLNKEYSVEERLMLTSGEYTALNDFVIKGCNPTRTSKFFLEIDGELVCDYIADGLIVATPTGSTAYGLSAGGPILHPSLSAIVVVPICPHTLNARPLVIPADDTITVRTSEELLSVAIDGYDTTKCFDKISIKTSQNRALLAFINNSRFYSTLSFYSTLRNKLNWGFMPEKS